MRCKMQILSPGENTLHALRVVLCPVRGEGTQEGRRMFKWNITGHPAPSLGLPAGRGIWYYWLMKHERVRRGGERCLTTHNFFSVKLLSDDYFRFWSHRGLVHYPLHRTKSHGHVISQVSFQDARGHPDRAVYCVLETVSSFNLPVSHIFLSLLNYTFHSTWDFRRIWPIRRLKNRQG